MRTVNSQRPPRPIRRVKAAIALALVVGLPVEAQPPSASDGASDLTVQITGIRNLQGEVRLALYLSREAYETREPDAVRVEAVSSARASARFEGLPAGSYAVLLYHDVDGNGRMTRGAFGLPSEPYASSSGRADRFGPPGWEAASRTLHPGANTVSLSLAGR